MKNRSVEMLLSALLVTSAIPSLTKANLIDGGFEAPVTTTPNLNNGGYVIEAVGTSFGGPSNNAWTVVQKGTLANNVLLQSTTEYFIASTKEYYNANSGLQDLDITGLGDNGAVVGVQQALATVPGQGYLVSFYVGRNSFNPGIPTTELDVNGAAVETYTNSSSSGFPSYNSDGVAVDSWQKFNYTFTASSASTTLAFYNLSPNGVNVNGLDDVSVSPVPEPASIGLLGLGSVVLWRRRHGR